MKTFDQHSGIARRLLRLARSILPPLVLLLLPVNLYDVFSRDGWSDEGSAYRRYFNDYARPKSVAYPVDNAYTPERELLGKTLFFDPRLSGSNWISCATCHNPALSWG